MRMEWNEIKRMKMTEWKKNNKQMEEFRWICRKCLSCCHNANYTQKYTLRVFCCRFVWAAHRKRVAFWLELLIYFDLIQPT